MTGIYFSGNGNTKHCIEVFAKELKEEVSCISMEDANVFQAIQKNQTILFAYPVYYSNLPKIVRDFIVEHNTEVAGKDIFLIATMGLFSGDGTGCAARLFKDYGVNIVGGLHLKMPDCIGDEKALKKTIEQNKQLVKEAEAKSKDAAHRFINGNPTQEGLGFFYHLAGLFGQRLWFYNKTKNYSNKLKIDSNKCSGCGLCEKQCPLGNLKVEEKKAKAGGKCTMCYRCVNNCPKQAITLLGKTLYEQCKIEKYL